MNVFAYLSLYKYIQYMYLNIYTYIYICISLNIYILNIYIIDVHNRFSYKAIRNIKKIYIYSIKVLNKSNCHLHRMPLKVYQETDLESDIDCVGWCTGYMRVIYIKKNLSYTLANVLNCI